MGVISYGGALPADAEFKKQCGLQIEQRAYSTAEEARDQVAELVAIGCGAIVGTGFISELADRAGVAAILMRSEEHTSELQSLMRISYAVVCLKKKKSNHPQYRIYHVVINRFNSHP